MTIPKNLPEDSQVILACYKGGKCVEVESAPNNNETIYFVISNEFDSTKVFVWDSFKTLVPLCEPEVVQ